MLTVPGVGQLRATCAAGGATSIDFLNSSGGAAEVIAWGVHGTPPGAAVNQQTGLTNGIATDGLPAPATASPLGLDYQVSFVKAGNLEVLTATVSAGPSAAGCIVTASAVTTA